MDPTSNKVRHHPEIPKVIVDTSRPTPLGQEVGRHVIITADPFTIQFVVQQGQTEPLFEIDRFVYDSYLNWVGMRALSTLKDSKFRGVMGLGERSSSKLFFDDGIYSMNAYDQSTSEDTGSGGKQTYGVHPFFMFQHSADKWVGVFSKQAHAQDWVVMNDKPNGRTTLKQIATGGISDFYIMINSNTPDSVIGYYQRIVGKPVLMPQWSLGWHQCKYCMRTLNEYQEVLDNYKKYNIPLDGQWGDIDYMHNYRNFKVDLLHFGDLRNYVNDLYNTSSRVKFIPIVDPAIAARPMTVNYTTYIRGIKEDVFLKSA
jgi:alpha-glucosidase (family GH31 glycosyl hydrolase)